jgi:acyl carrier protein
MDHSARPAVQNEVLEVLAAALKFDPAQFRGELSLADSGVDSLALVEAVFVIEERFDISVPFNANEQVSSADGAFGSIGQLLEQIVDLVMARRVGSLAPEPV